MEETVETASIQDESVVYLQKRHDYYGFYVASVDVKRMNEHEGPYTVHHISPAFKEKELGKREWKWFAIKRDALTCPRYPNNLHRWVLFTDKEDGEKFLAQLIWGGRCNYPVLCYQLWGKRLKKREDIGKKTKYNFRVSVSALFTYFPSRSYKREYMDSYPEVPLDFLTKSENTSLGWHKKRHDENKALKAAKEAGLME
jgi:hypothetical protein